MRGDPWTAVASKMKRGSSALENMVGFPSIPLGARVFRPDDRYKASLASARSGGRGLQGLRDRVERSKSCRCRSDMTHGHATR